MRVAATNAWRFRMKTSLDIFEANAFPEPNSGCWIWMGGVRGVNNNLRPVMQLDREPVCAYRFSYVHFIGAVPDGMFVCHRCHNGLCVNPDHLYVGTPQQNTDDMMRAGRHFSQGDNNPRAMAALKKRISEISKRRLLNPTCSKGHLLDAENMYAHPSGRRVCKTCRLVWKTNFRRRNGAKPRYAS